MPTNNLEEEQLWQAAGAADILKELGPISEEEVEYYLNLPDANEELDKGRTGKNQLPRNSRLMLAKIQLSKKF